MSKREGGKTVRPPEPPVHAEPPALKEAAPVSDQVVATVTRAAPAPPTKKVYKCLRYPGITREATVEDVTRHGAPYCPCCGVRMEEDTSGKL